MNSQNTLNFADGRGMPERLMAMTNEFGFRTMTHRACAARARGE
jgi:hypothetical protein